MYLFHTHTHTHTPLNSRVLELALQFGMRYITLRKEYFLLFLVHKIIICKPVNTEGSNMSVDA